MSESGKRTDHRVQFTGDLKSYYGIWLTNLVLTVLTLGIYSAWASVRSRKYFLQNTLIDGHRFDYHATGKQILIGRLIALAVIGGLGLLSVINPIAYLVCFAVLATTLPYLQVRSLRFNGRATSWRNVHFDFVGRTGPAYRVFFLWPLLSLFTFFLLSPLALRAASRYVIRGFRFGGAAFAFDASVWRFYRPFVFVVGGFLLVLALLVLAIMLFLGQHVGSLTYSDAPDATWKVVSAVSAIVFFLSVGLAGQFFQAMMRNVMFNNTTLDGRCRFVSNVSGLSLAFLALTNLLIIVFSLGLLTPWAQLRRARFFAEHTRVLADGPLDGFASEASALGGAAAAEFFSLEGVHVGPFG